MTQVDWFPCRIEPLNYFGFDRCEPLPGVTIARMSTVDCRRLDELRKRYGISFSMSDKPNVLIAVDQERYEPFLIGRLAAEGYDIKKYIAEVPEDMRRQMFLIFYEPVRHLLTSMALLKPFRLTTPSGQYTFDKIVSSKKTQLRPASFAPFRPHEQSSALLGYRPYQKSSPPVTGRQLKRVAVALEPYYRPVHWRSDRLAIALNSFWSFLFSQFPEHSFLSLTVMLEALVSTSNVEVIHQISERLAVLLESSLDQRLTTYRKVKALYKLRSEIAHGSMVAKKGKITLDTSHMDAKGSIVSVSRYCELAEISVRTILSVLGETALMNAIRSGKTEQIDDFYLRRLLA